MLQHPFPPLAYTTSGIHPTGGSLEFAFATLENANAMSEALRRDGYRDVTVVHMPSPRNESWPSV
jgi:hypothetical protein